MLLLMLLLLEYMLLYPTACPKSLDARAFNYLNTDITTDAQIDGETFCMPAFYMNEHCSFKDDFLINAMPMDTDFWDVLYS